MIGRLRGELIEVFGSTAVVDCHGVGYEVMVPESVLARLPVVGEPIDLRIRQVFREDGVALFGFLDAFQRRLFDLLTEVKGCGPKISLAILGQIGEQAVVGAILAGDAKALARANGVGPRLAERIILELKDKIGEEAAAMRISQAVVQAGARQSAPEDEVVEALVTLGYRRQDAEAAASSNDGGDGTVEDRLVVALRRLNR